VLLACLLGVGVEGGDWLLGGWFGVVGVGGALWLEAAGEVSFKTTVLVLGIEITDIFDLSWVA